MNRQEVENKINEISNKMRSDDHTKLVTKYIEHISWLLFLRAFDAMENEQEALDSNYQRVINEKTYRWTSWAKKDWAAGELVSFINEDLFPYLRQLSGSRPKEVVAQIFHGVATVMKSGFTLKEVVAEIDSIDISTAEDFHVLSLLYESLLARMGNEKGWSGEIYTPRPIVRFMVEVTQPTIGQTVYDPAAGSGGFLVEAFAFMRRQEATLEEHVRLQVETFFGQENGELPFLLGVMNLVLHGLHSPNLVRVNTLEHDIRSIKPSEQYSIILTNPPFGGKEHPQVQQNFPIPLAATEMLFLQHIIAKMEPGGRAAVVIPEGALNNDNFTPVRDKLLLDCQVTAIVKMPDGAFAPYSDVQTNLVFFEKGRPTDKVWFYELPPPVGTKKYSKTRPVRLEHFDECLRLMKAREVSLRSWIVPAENILANSSNLAIKNPTNADPKHLGSPATALTALGEEALQVLELQKSVSAGFKAADKSAWIERKLGELATRVKRPSQLQDDIIYSQVTVQLWGRGLRLRKQLLGKEIKTKAQFVVEEGDLVIARIDARNGAVGVVPAELDGAIVSNDFWALRVEEGNATFLARLLSSPHGISLLAAASTGSTNRKRLSQELFKNIVVRVPVSTQEQEEIVAYLDLLDTAKGATKTLSDTLYVTEDLILTDIFG